MCTALEPALGLGAPAPDCLTLKPTQMLFSSAQCCTCGCSPQQQIKSSSLHPGFNFSLTDSSASHLSSGGPPTQAVVFCPFADHARAIPDTMPTKHYCISHSLICFSHKVVQTTSCCSWSRAPSMCVKATEMHSCSLPDARKILPSQETITA